MILLPLFIGKEINLFPFKKGTQAAKDQDSKKVVIVAGVGVGIFKECQKIQAFLIALNKQWDFQM